jgi:hypothetical protein
VLETLASQALPASSLSGFTAAGVCCQDWLQDALLNARCLQGTRVDMNEALLLIAEGFLGLR